MALDKVTKISAHQRETSMEQQEEFLTHQGREASTEVASPRGAEIDRESLSCDSRDRETASNNSWRLKVAVVAALSGISYVFGLSHITETRVGSIELCSNIMESMPEPRANKVVIFEDFFTIGLDMPPHPVQADILHKFQVQLHHLTLNAIV
jgi:hypothetical protein